MKKTAILVTAALAIGLLLATSITAWAAAGDEDSLGKPAFFGRGMGDPKGERPEPPNGHKMRIEAPQEINS